jgi:hypothetical protein
MPENWRCAGCGAYNPPRKNACWKCKLDRTAQAKPGFPEWYKSQQIEMRVAVLGIIGAIIAAIIGGIFTLVGAVLPRMIPEATTSPTQSVIMEGGGGRYIKERLGVYAMPSGKNYSANKLLENIDEDGWPVYSNNASIIIEGRKFDFRSPPPIYVKEFMLLCNRDTVINDLIFVVDSFQTPSISQLHLYGIPVGGFGGDMPTPIITLNSIEVKPVKSTYTTSISTTSEILSLPYNIKAKDYLRIFVPIIIAGSGDYGIHLEMNTTGFSGEKVRISSPVWHFRRLILSNSELNNMPSSLWPSELWKTQ